MRRTRRGCAAGQLRYASRRTRSGVLISYINYTESGQKCNYDFMTKSYKFVILCKPIVAHFAFRRHFFFRREIQTKVPRKNHFFVFFEIYLRKKRTASAGRCPYRSGMGDVSTNKSPGGRLTFLRVSVSKNYPACHCDVAAVGDEGALRMRALRLPVGAKRRGNLMQAVSNSPKII